MTVSMGTGMSGRMTRTGGGGVCTWCHWTEIPSEGVKGSWPVSISCKTQPRAYRSAGGPTALARACSGAMYGGVPTVCPGHGELDEPSGAEQRGDPEVEYFDDAARGEEQVAR